MIFKHVLLSATALISLATCKSDETKIEAYSSKPSISQTTKAEWRLSGQAMAAAANPHAVKAAEKILATGGMLWMQQLPLMLFWASLNHKVPALAAVVL